MSDQKRPWEYLLTCSRAGLEAYELSERNKGSQLRKVLGAELDRLVEALTNAEITRLIRENAEELAKIGSAQTVFKFEETWEVQPEPDTARDRIPARRGRPAQRYRARDVA